MKAHITLSDVYAAVGRHGDAVEEALAGVEHARSVGLNRVHGIFLRCNAVESLLRLGRLDEAARLLGETAQLQTAGAPDSFVACLRTELALLRGSVAEAQAELAAVPISAGEGSPQDRLPEALLRSEVARVTGEPLRACRLAVLALDTVRPEVPRYAWPVAWAGLRAACEAPSDEADGLVSRLETVMRRLPAAVPPAIADRALCELELARYRGSLAPQMCIEAVQVCRAAQDPYRVAYALLRLGEAESIGKRDPHAATIALSEAAEIASEFGAGSLLESVRTMARRAGVAVSGGDDAGSLNPLGLTARELDVLQLIAAGRSNGEIGEALFITRKTASVHVSTFSPSSASRGVARRRRSLIGPGWSLASSNAPERQDSQREP